MRPLVAIPVKNRLDLTKPLVTALKADDDCDIIVFDNGSSDGTAEWCLAEGIGYVMADGWTLHEMWNRALECCSQPTGHVPAVILNNDLKLDGKPSWVTRLCAPFSDREIEWDALCPNYDQSPVLTWRPTIRLRGVSKCRLDGSGGLSGFAFALSPRFLSTGYRFPTDLKWWYGDNDLVMRLDAEARPYGMVAGVGVEHIGGGSQTAKEHDLSAVQAADLAVFEEKWGVLL